MDVVATVATNDRITSSGFVMELRLPPGTPPYAPGRFLMLAPSAAPIRDPFLRRPFSALDDRPSNDGGRVVSILYEIVGRGTALFAEATPGARFRTLGPLGKGFPLPSTPPTGDRDEALLVAGGVGVAPFPLLTRMLRAAGREVRVLFGARDRDHLFVVDRLRALGASVETITDAGDGPSGRKGLVTRLLEDRLARDDAGRIERVSVCGPEPMMAAVVDLARAAALPTEVSMERRMACGFGVCWTCVCRQRVRGGDDYENTRTCMDGPVIDIDRLPEDGW